MQSLFLFFYCLKCKGCVSWKNITDGKKIILTKTAHNDETRSGLIDIAWACLICCRGDIAGGNPVRANRGKNEGFKKKGELIVERKGFQVQANTDSGSQ